MIEVMFKDGKPVVSNNREVAYITSFDQKDDLIVGMECYNVHEHRVEVITGIVMVDSPENMIVFTHDRDNNYYSYTQDYIYLVRLSTVRDVIYRWDNGIFD